MWENKMDWNRTRASIQLTTVATIYVADTELNIGMFVSCLKYCMEKYFLNFYTVKKIIIKSVQLKWQKSEIK